VLFDTRLLIDVRLALTHLLLRCRDNSSRLASAPHDKRGTRSTGVETLTPRGMRGLHVTPRRASHVADPKAGRGICVAQVLELPDRERRSAVALGRRHEQIERTARLHGTGNGGEDVRTRADHRVEERSPWEVHARLVSDRLELRGLDRRNDERDVRKRVACQRARGRAQQVEGRLERDSEGVGARTADV